MTRKGFVYSIDAILAVLIAAMFIAAFAYLSAQEEEDRPSALYLKKEANDLLAVLDKAGDLQTVNATLINNSVNASLYPSVNYNIEVLYYNFSANNFPLIVSFSRGTNYSNVTQFVLAQRKFITFSNRTGNSTIHHYGIARLRLWPK